MATQSELVEVFDLQRKRSLQLRNESINGRLRKLKTLRKWVKENRPRIIEAVQKDLGKPPLEIESNEIYTTVGAITHIIKNLERWVLPKKIDAPIEFIGTKLDIWYEPKGVCLIISPWNFPFQLCLRPLAYCIAAGNTAILKPSEISSHTTDLLAELVEDIFSPEEVTVIKGSVDTATELLKLPFDHIYFTGSTVVGKIVMKAAAENLTSVTLELGGKSPTIIDETANLKDTAKRIVFGKFINNGQTCLAPDYVFVKNEIKQKFILSLQGAIKELFDAPNEINEDNPHYARIISTKQIERLNRLLQDALERGSMQIQSGNINIEKRFFPPALLTDVPWDSLLMNEEIFGPILPIFSYDSEDEVIERVNQNPKPLALYIFSKNKTFQKKILKATSSGTACVNDCVVHFAHPEMPFGGVNESGIGKSHGYYGFLAFSNEKPVLRQKSGFTTTYAFYPPYTRWTKRIMDWIFKLV